MTKEDKFLLRLKKVSKEIKELSSSVMAMGFHPETQDFVHESLEDSVSSIDDLIEDLELEFRS